MLEIHESFDANLIQFYSGVTSTLNVNIGCKDVGCWHVVSETILNGGMSLLLCKLPTISLLKYNIINCLKELTLVMTPFPID